MPLALWFMFSIAGGAIHQHLLAQEVTTKAPPAESGARVAPGAAERSNTGTGESGQAGTSGQAQELPDLETIPRAVPITRKSAAGTVESVEADLQAVHGDLLLFSGNVEAVYGNRRLHADTVTYNRETGELVADGHLRIAGGDNGEAIEASHGTYNLRTGVGRLYDVTGSVAMRANENTVVAEGSPNAFLFGGRVVVKKGPEAYDIYDGWVTSCRLPRPDWELTSGHVWVDGRAAHAKNSTFKLLNLPILFLPYVTHPATENQRQSGLLIPVISPSSSKGVMVGEEMYFTLGRSADATAGFDYYSLRGFAEKGTLRYRGQHNDFVNAHFSALQDRGFHNNAGAYINQGGEDVVASFRRNFTGNTRAVGDAEYLSSYVYREAFTENFNQAVSSDITSMVYVTRQANGLDVSGRFDRYQGLKRVPFTDKKGRAIAGEDLKIFHAPSVEAHTIDRAMGPWPLLWKVDSSAAGLKRVQPNYSSIGVVPRVDVRPELALPLRWDGWNAMASVALRETAYGHSRKTPYGAAQIPVELKAPVSRTSFEARVDVRPPVVEREFAVPAKLQRLFGSEVRHAIEPELTYSNTRGIGDFLSLLRFDDADLDSDTNELEYGVTQHLYFRRPEAAAKAMRGCAAVAGPGTSVGAADNPAEAGAAENTLTPTAENSTDANGIPSASATAPDAPLRATAKHDPCATGKQRATQKEWFSWRLAQRHFFDGTFGGAVINQRRNVFDTTLSLSGIAFLTEGRDISPLISRMRFRTSSHTDVEWDFDLDTGASRFMSSNVFADVHEGDWFGGFSYARLNAPGRFYKEIIDTTNNTATLQASPISNFSQMRVLLGYGAPLKPGLSMAANAGLDLGNSSLQYASLQASYNWNCCGLSVEYRKYELGPVRNEGVERFSFTLINIGSAGNLRRQERLF